MIEQLTKPFGEHKTALRLIGSSLFVALMITLGLIYYDHIQFSGLFPECVFAPLFAVTIMPVVFVWLRPRRALIALPLVWLLICIAAGFAAGNYTYYSLEAQLDQTIQAVRQGQHPAGLLGYPLSYERLQQDFRGPYQVLQRGGEFGCSDFVISFGGDAKYHLEFCPQRNNKPSVHISTWKY